MAKEPIEWDIEDVERLVTEGVQENTHLEYKSINLLGKSSEQKMKIAKAVSAMANADGGVILFGVVEENHVPVRVEEGVDPKKTSREWLEQVIASRIKRKVPGVRIRPIPTGTDSRTLYAVLVPRSERPPHQMPDGRFYIRRNFTIEVMEEYEVRDAYARQAAPDVGLEVFFRRRGACITRFPISWVDPDTPHTVEVNATLTNAGGGEVRAVLLTIVADARLMDEKPVPGLVLKDYQATVDGKPLAVRKGYYTWKSISGLPLFREIPVRLFEPDVPIHFKKDWVEGSDAPFIAWDLHTPGMEPRLGCVRLRRDGEDVILESREVPDLSEVSQDGRNRQFLTTPDLSLPPEVYGYGAPPQDDADTSL
jgi:hypothetical protein